MPGLRDILAAATPGQWKVREVQHHWNDYSYQLDVPKTAENARLAALAPELAALALDMGEELRAWKQWAIRSFGADEEVSPSVDALLARLDQLGKEQTT